MNLVSSTLKHIAHRSHRLARAFHRQFNGLTRRAELTLAITVAIPPFLKVEVGYKKNFGKPANDNNRRPRPSRSA